MGLSYHRRTHGHARTAALPPVDRAAAAWLPASMQGAPGRAMVFAAGFGKRMRPLTDARPKPLIEVAGSSMLDRALDHLQAAGVERAVVNTHHLAEQVAVHLEARQGGPQLSLSHEDPVLETGGGVVQALPMLGEGPFLTINGDVVWTDRGESAVARLWGAFDPEDMDALLLLHPVERAVGYDGRGDFALEPGGQIFRPEERDRPLVFTGLQVLHPRLLAGRRAEPFSLAALYRDAWGEGGRLARMFGLVHQGDWLHIGTPEGLAVAERHLAEREP